MKRIAAYNNVSGMEVAKGQYFLFKRTN